MARTSGSHSVITGPKILKCAMQLFAQHGYAAVSMRKIASEVGVQAGALYNYTPDKQSLLFGLMRNHMLELAQAWADHATPGTPLERLEQFARFHIQFNHERQDEVFIAYMELRNLNDENFAEIDSLRRDYQGKLEAILKDGVAAGVFAMPDTKIAAMALIAMLNGVNTWFREAGPLSLDQVETLYWDMARKSVEA